MSFLSSASLYRLADRFVPASLQQSVAVRRRAHMFVVACLLAPPLAVLGDIPLYVIDPEPGLAFWAVLGGLLGLWIYPFLLRRSGALDTLTAVDINHATFLFLFGAFQYGEVNSSFLIPVSFIPLVAAFSIHDRRLRGAALAGIAIQGLIFYALQFSGHRFPHPVPSDALASITVLTLVLVTIFVWMMSAYYAGIVAMQQVTLEQEIGDHQRAAAMLRRAMEEAQRAHALEAQLRQSQRVEALGTLAGGIAHDINNALVPVIALTKLVARKLPEGSREKNNLGMVLSGAERSHELVRRILSFSRKEDRRRERFDLADLLRDALGMMRASLPATIRLDHDVALTAMIDGDPTQFRQVIVNLVTNAAQAIGEAMGTITVRLDDRAVQSRLLLSVSDTGCGMDDATRARVFEPFFTTKTVGRGTGLGLAVVHGIVKDHGGDISVESALGRGSRFDLLLPISAPKVADAGGTPVALTPMAPAQ